MFQCFSLVVVLIILEFWKIEATRNNVCHSFSDYSTIEQNQNCWYNPDVNAPPEAMAKNHGYNLERHPVTTEDGYILTLFRVRGNYSDANTSPILMHHGILSSAMCFMTSGKRSAAFYYADNGYDVWLANIRGNPFSTGHTIYNTSDLQYWNFSFHEVAMYDVPAYVEYINNLTKPKNKITYIGHSMGTTIAFIYSSVKKEHAEKYLNGFVMLAPVASLKYYFSPLRSAIPMLRRLTHDMMAGHIVSLFPSERQRKLINLLCTRQPSMQICYAVLGLFLGPMEQKETPAEDMPVFLSYHPSTTALKTLNHFEQIVSIGRFQHYDYGPEGNIIKYNQTTPPKYRIRDIKLPVHIYYGKNDYFSGENDALLIYKHLRTSNKFMMSIPKNEEMKYNHGDFLYGKNMVSYLHKPVLKSIQTFQSYNKSE